MSWQLDHFIHGITQGYMAERHFLTSPKGRESTLKIAETGCDLVTVVINQFQADLFATEIGPDNEHTISDEALVQHLDFLHELGYGIMLKPMVDPLDSTWRGSITLRRGCNTLAWRTSDRVTPWFDSYWRFMRRYAEIAEQTHCEMFCIGCELQGMEDHHDDWSNLIDKIREIYHGILTHNMNRNVDCFWESRGWFRKLDLLGLSGYFEMLKPIQNPTYPQIMDNWRTWLERISVFHDWVKRPLFFAETGTRPIVGAAIDPAGYSAKDVVYSEQAQADFYDAIHETFEPIDWFYGTVWWKHDEHQDRPQFHLPDGHITSFEPTPLLKQHMRERAASRLPRKTILPSGNPAM